MNRNSYPSWVNRLIDRIADSPTSFVGRIAARRLGAPAPQGTVQATAFEDKPIRILIAPVNYSGQGTAWAKALNTADDTISAKNMAIEVPGGFSFAADLVVPVGTYHNDRDWQERQFEATASATHVLIEAEEPPFGRMMGRDVAAQARALTQRGVNVAFLAHGTDARLPSRHIANNPLSYYATDGVYVPRAEQLAARNIRLVTTSGRPAFVSTPDLLVDLPDAKWCPVVVDPERWSARERAPRPAGAPLRVAHAPSVAAYKGTELILPTLDKLQREGVIEYRLIQGVPSSDMPAVFAGADVMLDQFRAGSYGVAACEAMAAGCVAVGQVSEQVRDVVRTQTGRELAVREADPESLEALLRELAAAPDLAAQQAASVSFVREVHDGRLAAKALLDHWVSPTGLAEPHADPRPNDREEPSRASRH